MIAAASVLAAAPLRGQRADLTTVIDSIAVEGANRTGRAFVVSRIGILPGAEVNYREVARAIKALYETGQYSNVEVFQGTFEETEVLQFRVTERPILTRWSVEGTGKLSDRSVRGRVRLVTGRPYNPAHAAASVSRIDSLYRKEGYYQTDVDIRENVRADGNVHVVFDVNEGPRVAISNILVEGNDAFTDEQLVGQMKTGPEGFFWFKQGDFSDEELERDMRDRLPSFYASNGFIDFQVVSDTLIVHEELGKATLVLEVREGDRYEVGTFQSIGNRHFNDQQLAGLYPFNPDVQVRTGGFLGIGGGTEARTGPMYFDAQKWSDATGGLQTLYANNGYIYAQVNADVYRRTEANGTKKVDLRWQVSEGSPAVVRRVRIIGNTITQEGVIRQAILMIPGDVFRQDALIQSYERISNLGFFEQPLPVPRTVPVNQQGDVDVVFEVQERQTGNINFGASVGQGTGVGGFIGLDQPNLFGKGKQVSFQWQFGSNINDFRVTYSDPAIRGSFISGTLTLNNTRQRFTVADLGRITTRGGSFRLGFPLLGSRFTRFFTSYTFEQSDFDTPSLTSRFFCAKCVLSSLGFSIVRDTRIGLPFATAGTMHQFEFSQNGGKLGGSGDFRRATFEGKWYAPLSGGGFNAGPLQFVLGFTAKAGFVWGDPGPHFRQLFSMGGTQFGIPLRGYEEFSITPQGFDPSASGLTVNTVGAFGASYTAMTAEIGLRLSQMLYMNLFSDAGNVWAKPEQFNPTRLFRGAGVGLSLLSPLGPIGLDYAYGLDRVDTAGNPDPGWKFHFKIGNFF